MNALSFELCFHESDSSWHLLLQSPSGEYHSGKQFTLENAIKRVKELYDN
jgi:hypothetical protein